MDVNEITKIIEETKRFLRITIEARNRLKKNPSLSITGCKETGSVRRASMDLSQVLIDLRKTNYQKDNE